MQWWFCYMLQNACSWNLVSKWLNCIKKLAVVGCPGICWINRVDWLYVGIGIKKGGDRSGVMIRSTSGSNKLSNSKPKLTLSCSSKFFSHASTILSCNRSIANSNTFFFRYAGHDGGGRDESYHTIDPYHLYPSYSYQFSNPSPLNFICTSATLSHVHMTASKHWTGPWHYLSIGEA